MTRAMDQTRYALRKAARLRRLRGETTHVDVAPVRAHLRRLTDAHLPLRSIACAAGQSTGFVHGVANGRFEKIRRDLADELLRVDFRPLPVQTTVLGVGLARRVHALAWLGWSLDYQAAELGICSSSGLSRVATAWTVRYERWSAVADLYDAHRGRAGPCERARRWAFSRGWAPPHAWTNDTIDHPHAWPAARPLWTPPSAVDPRAIRCAAAGLLPTLQLTRAERRQLVDQKGA